MAKYRKIALVEAVQWDGEDHSLIYYRSSSNGTYWLTSRTGSQNIRIGDYIITNPSGDTYLCPKDEFEKTYILVE